MNSKGDVGLPMGVIVALLAGLLLLIALMIFIFSTPGGPMAIVQGTLGFLNGTTQGVVATSNI
ncbi:Uncharacterised protein [Candidatus Tiddalikarchaeum anstoanum]|nr:Uncharacterised protein [Candidatus Tiddalikarchaeum anstoanum]